MVNDSLVRGVPIALAFVDGDYSGDFKVEVGQNLGFVRPIAGYGHPLVLEQRVDSSLLILLQGKGKLKLGAVQATNEPYLICQATPIEETHKVFESCKADLAVINKVLIRWVHQHIPEPSHREQLLKNLQTAEEIVGCYASYLISDADMQQLILETDDINEKIKLVMRLVSSGEMV